MVGFKLLKDVTGLDNLIKIINPTLIFTFGSTVDGIKRSSKRKSDIDICVVSSFFEGMSIYARSYYLKNTLKSKKELDIVGFTPLEYGKVKESQSFKDKVLKISKVVYKKQNGIKHTVKSL